MKNVAEAPRSDRVRTIASVAPSAGPSSYVSTTIGACVLTWVMEPQVAGTWGARGRATARATRHGLRWRIVTSSLCDLAGRGAASGDSPTSTQSGTEAVAVL